MVIRRILVVSAILIAAGAAAFTGILFARAVLYPVSFESEVDAVCVQYGLDKPLILAIINTESGFDPRAVSNRGACGLMQIMPGTAEYIARLSDFEDFTADRLFEPVVNIKLGAFYIKYLIGKFEDKTTAVAAYNAGEGTVRLWLSDPAYSGDGKTLKSIPYKETRAYVKRVGRAARAYARSI
ncbi:MAG: lytic transglycosylase domain-containing protein [Firmicutes bacterium]|nr:lytic transglycosylase domain-containing protein [Bacillota bacterium]